MSVDVNDRFAHEQILNVQNIIVLVADPCSLELKML
jgi:hypothetical protein